MEQLGLTAAEIKARLAGAVLHELVDGLIRGAHEKTDLHRQVRELSPDLQVAAVEQIRDNALAALEDLCGPVCASAGRLFGRFMVAADGERIVTATAEPLPDPPPEEPDPAVMEDGLPRDLTRRPRRRSS